MERKHVLTLLTKSVQCANLVLSSREGKVRKNQKEANMSVKMFNGETKYVGMVVESDCPCLQVMSDIWDYIPTATVFDDEDKYFCVSAREMKDITVDASPERIAAYKAKRQADIYAKQLKARKDAAILELNTIRCGKMVEVVRGRKVPKGTVGKVFWMKDTNYGMKVGIAIGDERDAKGRYANVAFTYRCNCETVVSKDELDAVEAII